MNDRLSLDSFCSFCDAQDSDKKYNKMKEQRNLVPLVITLNKTH